MASQSWVSLINAATPQGTGAGTALTTGTAKTTISPCQAGALTADVAVVNAAGQPSGWAPGLVLRIIAHGFLTTTATSSTLVFTVEANKGNTGGTYVILASTGTIAGTTTVLTGLQWKLEAVARCTAVASSGSTVSTMGTLVIGANATVPTLGSSANGAATWAPLPQASGETAASVDTTSLQGISLRCTPGTSAGVNPVQVSSWLVEALD